MWFGGFADLYHLSRNIYLTLYPDNQCKMLTYVILSSNLVLVADCIICLVIFILQYPDNQFKILTCFIFIARFGRYCRFVSISSNIYFTVTGQSIQNIDLRLFCSQVLWLLQELELSLRGAGHLVSVVSRTVASDWE